MAIKVKILHIKMIYNDHTFNGAYYIHRNTQKNIRKKKKWKRKMRKEKKRKEIIII